HEVGIDPIDVETAPDGDVELEDTAGFIVADCPECGGMLKPDVVYFGDSVPPARLQEANRICEGARGIVVLGSSLAVLSGLRFVRAAAKAGKPVVIVTDGPTRGDELADFRSLSRVSDFVTAWASRCVQAEDGSLSGMTAYLACAERWRLVAAARPAGEDSPSLCEGWTTRDLAAHLIIRERHPTAALGIFLSKFDDRREAKENDYAAMPFAQLLGL